MPGLQTLVSGWIKVNQGHVEYFGDAQLAQATQARAGAAGANGAVNGGGGALGTSQHSMTSSQHQGQISQHGQQAPLQQGQQQGQMQMQAGQPVTSVGQNQMQRQKMLHSSSSLSSYSFSNDGMLHQQLQQQMQHPQSQVGAMAPAPTINSHNNALPPSRHIGGNNDTNMGEPPATLSSAPGAAMPLHQYPQYQQHDPYVYRPSSLRNRGRGSGDVNNIMDNNILGNNNNSQSHFPSSNMTYHLNDLNPNSHHPHHHQINNYYSHKNPSQYNFDSLTPTPPQAGAGAILGRRKSDFRDSFHLDENRTDKTATTTASTATSMSSSLLIHQMSVHEQQQHQRAMRKEIVSLLTDVGGGGGDSDVDNDSVNNKTVSSGNNSHAGTVSKDNTTGGSSASATGSGPAAISSAENRTQYRTIGQQQHQQQQQHPSSTKPRKFGRQKIRKSHSRTDLVREMALDRNFSRNTGALSSLSAVAIPDPGTINGTISELDHSSSTVDSSRGASSRRRSSHVSYLPTTEEEVAMTSPTLGGIAPASSTSSGSGQYNAGDVSNLDGLAPLNKNVRMTSLGDSVYTSGGESANTQQASGGLGMQGRLPNRSSSYRGRNSSLGSSAGSVTDSLAAAANLRKMEWNISNGDSMGKDKQTIGTDSTAASTSKPLGSSDCNRCCQMEVTLMALQADLEYMRALELQREYVCKECENGSAKRSRQRNASLQSQSLRNNLDPKMPSPGQNALYPNISSDRSVTSVVSIGSRGSQRSLRLHPKRRVSGTLSIGARSQQPQQHPPGTNNNSNNHGGFGTRTAMFLRDASKRLSELSTRHKRQVKQTTHDRAYWQNDMHLKLEKFAMMCKNLNEEAAQRNNEVKETKQLLEKMTFERNALNSQIENLKARVALYEEESVEHARLRDNWEKGEAQILDTMDKALKERDETTEDLASRLDLAVETIETERRQQRMRRQIIFPSNRSSSQNIRENGKQAPNDASGVSSEQASKDELERIQKSKEVAKKARFSLEAAMLQSAARERELQKRLADMELELSQARASSKKNNAKDGTADSSYGLEVGLSLRRVTSTSSL